MSPALTDLAAPLRAHPARTALLFDFDGTLSPIVDDPAAAIASPAVSGLLEELAQQYRTVGVVSGRPVAFLHEQVPDSVSISGLYGLESRIDGQFSSHPDAGQWREVVAVAQSALEAKAAEGGPLHGAIVEAKGLSITVHVRTRSDLAQAVEAEVREIASDTGLEARPAKMSVELHPPIHTDKGAAVRLLAAGAAQVLYVGDDQGDLPAFAAVADLARSGEIALGVSVAVGGPELPEAVRVQADLVLDRQTAVPELLRALLPPVRSGPA